MASPTIVASNSNASGANGTNLTINLPNGSDVAGRRLVVGFTIDNQQAVTWPAGWTELGSADGAAGNSRLYVVYRDLDGTEGYPSTGATDVATVATTDGFSQVSFLVDGFDPAIAPEVQFVGQASTGLDPNPPSITPTGGSKDYLFLAFGGADGTNGAPSFTGFPTNYTLNQTSATSGFNGGTSTGGAGRQLTTAGPEDPSAFTLSGAEQREAATVVIHPTSGSGVTVDPGVGALVFTGFAPTIDTGPITITPGTGALVFTGFAPTISAPLTVSPGVGALVFDGFAPTITVTTSAQGWVEFDVIVESTGTTFNFRWAQLVSNPALLTVKAGSYLEYTKIS